jgi:hypothetical protein
MTKRRKGIMSQGVRKPELKKEGTNSLSNKELIPQRRLYTTHYAKIINYLPVKVALFMYALIVGNCPMNGKKLISKAMQELNFLKRVAQLGTKGFIDYNLNNDPESIGDLNRILCGTNGHAGEQYWRSIITILRKKKSSTGSKIPIVLKFVEFVSKI